MTPRRASPRSTNAFADFLGLEWVTPGEVRLAVRTELMNPAGLLLGPVSFALVDYCMASVVYEKTATWEAMATTNVAINYVTTVDRGEVVCRAWLEHRNRHRALLGADVRTSSRDLVATAIGTYAIFADRS